MKEKASLVTAYSEYLDPCPESLKLSRLHDIFKAANLFQCQLAYNWMPLLQALSALSAAFFIGHVHSQCMDFTMGCIDGSTAFSECST